MYETTRVKVSGIDEADGIPFTLEFEACVLTIQQLPDKLITTFSNGCVLVQRRVESVGGFKGGELSEVKLSGVSQA